MTAFITIPAREAAELVEAAGIPNGRRLLVDSAAAGLVKTYADAVATLGSGPSRGPVRSCTISDDLWRRIVESGDTESIWCGATIRLKGNGLIGGMPDVHVTGVRFGPGSLQQLIAHHMPLGCAARADPARATPQVTTAPFNGTPTPPVQAAPPAERRARRTANPAAIPPGAITVTVNQTKDITGLGRTTIDKLMGDGTLNG